MVTVKHEKPGSFYDEFERKGKGQKVTHYCPGCGHGTVHKFIAEAMSDFGIQDRTVFLSPVGCSVFAYYYLDCCNLQCAHGRAPAAGTGVRRTLKNAIVISYQGDGDLAGIGMGGIMHAANRGENMTVYFVNNAIYGMTGGQMAPTTLLGQRTATTPLGRSLANEGNPVGMSEVISALKAPVYVERVSLGNPGRVMRSRKAIRKGLQNQIDGKGFSFVEILSPCPVGWKMPAVESREWLIDNMEPVFPVKCFKDEGDTVSVETPVEVDELTDRELLDLFSSDRGSEPGVPPRSSPLKDQYVKISGFGGQGVMSAGILLANCAITEGVKTSWLPSYGAEMRGGTANASIILSENEIGAPVVENPTALIAMNAPSLDAFEEKMRPGGLVIINSSLVNRGAKREDITAIAAPVTDMARDLGAIMTANIIALSIYAAASGAVSPETIKRIIPVAIKKKNLIDINLKAVDAGAEWFSQNYPEGV